MARTGCFALRRLALAVSLATLPLCAFAQAPLPGTSEPPASAPVVPADEAAPSNLEALQGAAQRAAETVRGQSLTLGLGYAQTTGKFSRFRDIGNNGLAEITDNGTLAPLVQYNSQESYFWQRPLKVGSAALGYNFVANYASFSLNRQLTEGPFQGANVGTRVTGSYLTAAPMVFVRLGPLYPGRDISWKLGIGAGAAAVQYKGTVIATAPSGAQYLERVEYNADSLSLYYTEVWELQVERWSLLFKGDQTIGSAQHHNFSLEVYALTLAYTLAF